mmetsp:Transcript_50407/g.133939  ORF Transcript_50407/g.133939 Transcript_50407/m.133939 type:complete len:265 (+) Transcript_50407:202-996(+)
MQHRGLEPPREGTRIVRLARRRKFHPDKDYHYKVSNSRHTATCPPARARCRWSLTAPLLQLTIILEEAQHHLHIGNVQELVSPNPLIAHGIKAMLRRSLIVATGSSEIRHVGHRPVEQVGNGESGATTPHIGPHLFGLAGAKTPRPLARNLATTTQSTACLSRSTSHLVRTTQPWPIRQHQRRSSQCSSSNRHVTSGVCHAWTSVGKMDEDFLRRQHTNAPDPTEDLLQCLRCHATPQGCHNVRHGAEPTVQHTVLARLQAEEH